MSGLDRRLKRARTRTSLTQEVLGRERLDLCLHSPEHLYLGVEVVEDVLRLLLNEGDPLIEVLEGQLRKVFRGRRGLHLIGRCPEMAECLLTPLLDLGLIPLQLQGVDQSPRALGAPLQHPHPGRHLDGSSLALLPALWLHHNVRDDVPVVAGDGHTGLPHAVGGGSHGAHSLVAL